MDCEVSALRQRSRLLRKVVHQDVSLYRSVFFLKLDCGHQVAVNASKVNENAKNGLLPPVRGQ
jgi:hypothetical protein